MNFELVHIKWNTHLISQIKVFIGRFYKYKTKKAIEILTKLYRKLDKNKKGWGINTYNIDY